MKILFLISQLPYPADTGAKIRGFNLLKNLSASHSITLATFGDKVKDADKLRIIQKFCKEVILVPKKNNSFIVALTNLFSVYPYSSDKYYSRIMVKTIASMVKKEKFGLIHSDSLQVSRNVLGVKGIPKVLTEHNIEFRIFLRAVQSCKNPIKKLYFYIQYLKLKKYEINAVKQFDRVIAVSEEDKKFLLSFVSENKISVAPNGVDTQYFSPSTIDYRPNSLIFTGSMDWLPNIDAMEYFCKEILPLVWKVDDKVKLYIVGRMPPKTIANLAKKDSRITVTGAVEDVRPYLEKAALFITPLRIGGGTRLKILEAMAMGKAVLSTSIGCEGLAVKDMENIAISDTVSDFASKVIELLNDESLRNRLGSEGRRLVEKEYDWKTVADKLDIAWNEAANIHDVPMILYHDIREDGFDIKDIEIRRRPYVLEESAFERQMRYLHENGYKAITLSGFFADKSSKSVNGKTVAILFDDGLKSNYSKALPILKKCGIKATFFITAGKVGEADMMAWEDIKVLREAGMEIGSHSLSHSIPSKLTGRELEYELAESKKILEKNLGIKIDYFSTPTGFLNPRLPELARKAGYKAVVVSRASLNKADGGFILNKASIKRDYSFEKFIAMANGDFAIFNSLRIEQNARNRFKRILGPDIYNTVRVTVLGGAK